MGCASLHPSYVTYETYGVWSHTYPLPARKKGSSRLPPRQRCPHPIQRLFDQEPGTTEVEPDETGGVELAAVGKSYPGLLEEAAGMLDAALSCVDPGEIGGFHMGDSQAGHGRRL